MSQKIITFHAEWWEKNRNRRNPSDRHRRAKTMKELRRDTHCPRRILREYLSCETRAWLVPLDGTDTFATTAPFTTTTSPHAHQNSLNTFSVAATNFVFMLPCTRTPRSFESESGHTVPEARRCNTPLIRNPSLNTRMNLSGPVPEEETIGIMRDETDAQSEI